MLAAAEPVVVVISATGAIIMGAVISLVTSVVKDRANPARQIAEA